jgi:post-segregation antitoxin (ccd killing protein)
MMMFVGTMGVMAQKNIDKVVEELEKSDEASINSVTKRDPKTRKVTRMIKTFSLTDIKMAKRLIAAFEKDEEYAISAMKDMPKGRKSAMKVNFTFTFQQDNEKSMYSLSTNENGKIELSINISRSNSSNINVSQNWEREIEKWSKDVDKWTTDINKHVDELGCIVSKSIKYDEKNNRLVLEGDVYIDGKKMKKGNYKMKGREVIVQ